jgi:hypothetical protein
MDVLTDDKLDKEFKEDEIKYRSSNNIKNEDFNLEKFPKIKSDEVLHTSSKKKLVNNTDDIINSIYELLDEHDGQFQRFTIRIKKVIDSYSSLMKNNQDKLTDLIEKLRKTHYDQLSNDNLSDEDFQENQFDHSAIDDFCTITTTNVKSQNSSKFDTNVKADISSGITDRKLDESNVKNDIKEINDMINNIVGLQSQNSSKLDTNVKTDVKADLRSDIRQAPDPAALHAEVADHRPDVKLQISSKLDNGVIKNMHIENIDTLINNANDALNASKTHSKKLPNCIECSRICDGKNRYECEHVLCNECQSKKEYYNEYQELYCTFWTHLEKQYKFINLDRDKKDIVKTDIGMCIKCCIFCDGNNKFECGHILCNQCKVAMEFENNDICVCPFREHAHKKYKLVNNKSETNKQQKMWYDSNGNVFTKYAVIPKVKLEYDDNIEFIEHCLICNNPTKNPTIFKCNHVLCFSCKGIMENSDNKAQLMCPQCGVK